MKILEVRDGFIKYESEKKVSLSSFVQIQGLDKKYIAQVIQVKHAGEQDIAYAKILFIYDDMFLSYDKTLPSIDSEVAEFDIGLINKSFEIENPIKIAAFNSTEFDITIDKNSFDKKTLVSIDNPEITQKLVKNLSTQFERSIVIDTLGTIEGARYVAGADFKLPLNTASLDFIFGDCLTDATSDSKDLIKEIFQDLAEYSKTVPFVPFGVLKNIVDDMVNKSHVFKLLVLKNKLAKFDKLGYFATTAEEAENLSKILSSKNVVIDLSKLDTTFQNRYLNVIYSSVQSLNIKPQILLTASNLLDKKNLKRVLTGSLPVAFITHSRFKYINEIRAMFNNFIIEPSFVNKDVFKMYSTFLSAMAKDNLLIVGEATNFLPLVTYLKEETYIVDIGKEELLAQEIIALDKALEEESPTVNAINKKSEDLIEQISEQIKTEENPLNTEIFIEEEAEEEAEEEPEVAEEIAPSEQTEEEFDTYKPEEDLLNALDNEEELIEESFSNEFHTEIDDYKAVEVPEEISELTEISLEEEIIEESQEEILDIQNEEIIEYNNEQEIPVEEEEEANNELLIPENIEELDELKEIEEINIDDTDSTETIIVNFEENETTDSEALDKEIVEDVDKVFTTIKEDSISDSDLDFIDELNGNLEEDIVLSEGMEELTELVEDDTEEEEFLQPIAELSDEVDEEKEVLETRNTSTPIVPVYDAEIPAEDLVISDPIEQGDTVVHAKYGNGIVEKMIKYGTKTLYSINFDNVGRRLLDPTLTEIKKA